MLGGKSWDEWIAQYSLSHQHPINRVCHTIGIPLIAVSLPLFLVAIAVPGGWPIPLGLFLVGWLFQFAGMPSKGSHRSSSRIGAFCSWDFGGGSPRSGAESEIRIDRLTIAS